MSGNFDEYMNAIIDEIINKRTEEMFMESVQTEEDKKYVEVLKVMAKRHNMSFAQLLNILTELAVMTQFKE